MKNFFMIALNFVLLSVAISFFARHAISQETAALEVADAAVCLEVVNRECVGMNTVFPSNVGKLFCLTRINGAKGPGQVTHVWYFGQTERARIALNIQNTSWRTYSSKIIQSHEIGDWHIDVLGLEGELLKIIRFEIVPFGYALHW
ncbi:MAG: DUF2914 domain-containing protein [Desulfatiglandaceae bacterium]